MFCYSSYYAHNSLYIAAVFISTVAGAGILSPEESVTQRLKATKPSDQWEGRVKTSRLW